MKFASGRNVESRYTLGAIAVTCVSMALLLPGGRYVRSLL